MSIQNNWRYGFVGRNRVENHSHYSVNVYRHDITKGQHWHNRKLEQFIVVYGHGIIQERKIGTEETVEFEVSGDRIQAVQMLPGWTHNNINLSETEPMVTLVWATRYLNLRGRIHTEK